MHIALFEQESPQMQLLVATLSVESQGAFDQISCTQFSDARALRAALADEFLFDLLILDYNYEEFGGLALLRWLRNHRLSKVPVIMLSQRSSERDIAESLSAGADDFVAKPFRPIELRARIERFRPKQEANRGAETFGDWTLFHESALVILAGSPDRVFDLSEREFCLAVALFRNLGRVVSRYELLAATNQVGRTMSTRILDNQIFNLRRTLSLESNGLMLQTVYGQGYRLVDTGSVRAPGTRSASVGEQSMANPSFRSLQRAA